MVDLIYSLPYTIIFPIAIISIIFGCIIFFNEHSVFYTYTKI